MNGPHPSADVLRAVLEGTGTPAEREAVMTHLDEGCPECEERVAATFDDDTLARLLSAEAAGPVAAPALRRVPTRRVLWAAVPLLAAASVLLVLWPGEPDTRPKDTPSAPIVSATFRAGSHQGNDILLERDLRDGATIRDTEVLAVAMETSVPAARVAFVVTADGRRVPFWPLSPGEVAVAEPQPGELGAYDLAGESGTLTFVAAASPVPVTPQALADRWPGDSSVGWTSITLTVTR